MAILRSQDGKFYEVDDAALEGKEVAPENVPNLTPGGTLPPPSGAAAGGVIQIYVSSPGSAQGADPGPPEAGAGAEGAAEADVQGHDWCRPRWRNHWHNWHNWNNWNNSWHNHHRGW